MRYKLQGEPLCCARNDSSSRYGESQDVPRKVKAEKLGIVADDLTGSLDTGVQFSKWGLSSLVSLRDLAPLDVACVIMNTDSRVASPDMAADKAWHAARLLLGRLVYKKIDSTLRGNLGAEILAVMQSLSLEKAIVAPAFPANGRTTLKGNLFVRGVLLEQTGFVRDPRNAINESHIPSLLNYQTGETVDSVGMDTVAHGPEAIREAISRFTSRIVVVDAETQQHLSHIARAIVRSDRAWLPVGSAGLAEELPAALGLAKSPVPSANPPNHRGPVLVVAGSRNEITAEQVREMVEALDAPVVEPHLDYLLDRDAAPREVARLADEVVQHLAQSQVGIVTTCFAPLVEDRSGDIAAVLGRLTRHILERQPIRDLFLTGGDIALQVCLSLDAEALCPITEVLPGLPVSSLIGGPWEGMRIITKAGGFGAKDAILVGTHYLMK